MRRHYDLVVRGRGYQVGGVVSSAAILVCVGGAPIRPCPPGPVLRRGGVRPCLLRPRLLAGGPQGAW